MQTDVKASFFIHNDTLVLVVDYILPQAMHSISKAVWCTLVWIWSRILDIICLRLRTYNCLSVGTDGWVGRCTRICLRVCPVMVQAYYYSGHASYMDCALTMVALFTYEGFFLEMSLPFLLFIRFLALARHAYLTWKSKEAEVSPLDLEEKGFWFFCFLQYYSCNGKREQQR